MINGLEDFSQDALKDAQTILQVWMDTDQLPIGFVPKGIHITYNRKENKAYLRNILLQCLEVTDGQFVVRKGV